MTLVALGSKYQSIRGWRLVSETRWLLTSVVRLKCNREQPCQNCKTRNEEATCKFRGASKNGAVPGVVHGEANGDGGVATRKRIDHLEDLVKKLIAARQQASSVKTNSNDEITLHTPRSFDRGAQSRSSPTAGTQEPDLAGAGETVMDGMHSVYHGGDEWYTVLREVRLSLLRSHLWCWYQMSLVLVSCLPMAVSSRRTRAVLSSWIPVVM